MDTTASKGTAMHSDVTWRSKGGPGYQLQRRLDEVDAVDSGEHNEVGRLTERDRFAPVATGTATASSPALAGERARTRHGRSA